MNSAGRKVFVSPLPSCNQPNKFHLLESITDTFSCCSCFLTRLHKNKKEWHINVNSTHKKPLCPPPHIQNVHWPLALNRNQRYKRLIYHFHSIFFRPSIFFPRIAQPVRLLLKIMYRIMNNDNGVGGGGGNIKISRIEKFI